MRFVTALIMFVVVGCHRPAETEKFRFLTDREAKELQEKQQAKSQW
jgi:hypothetical protein